MADKRKTIILVDDDIIHLTTGKEILKDMYNVFPVPSGERLFEILEKVTPDLILLDIEMPVMSGYEVIKQLRNGAKTADIPVIFLSAHIDPGHELEGLGLGAVDYVFKPFSPLLLMRRIETHTLLASQKEELKRYNENFQAMALKNREQAAELQNSITSAIAELEEFQKDNLGDHIAHTQQHLQLLSDHFAELVKAAN